MSPDRWQQVERLFAEAMARDPSARAAFLAGACAGDEELLCEVESLLAASARSGMVDRLFIDLIGPLAEDLAGPSIEGRHAGPYRILRAIGQGGMGAVYLAERDDAQFHQQVALKLIRRGLDSPEMLSRFLAERQILARLQHPNIARLLDGGVTEDGQPYFAMEYVEGIPLHTYCDTNRLPVGRRLNLFEAVCEAVQYAHQNLVVHRDLKPGNILVTGDEQVRLLDFGIAKLLEEEESAAGPLTRTGMRLMTPDYASPEQVRGQGVTTASDVYALGVLLYELLTGHRPYEIQTLVPGEIERVICEAEPPRPSTAVGRGRALRTTTGETRSVTAEEISRARSTRPEKLRRRLQGDLDTIVLKALQKEPERRYRSAEQLLEDLRRHRDGKPVQARPDTLGYRMSRFVRRHRVGVAAALLVVLSLVAGIAGTTWQAVRASRALDQARIEAAKAQQVSGFLIDLFQVSDPAEALGDTVTALQLLEEGAARIEREMAGQPEIQATLMDVMGQVYQNLGRYDDARPLLEHALRVRRRTFGEAHPDVAQSLDHQALLHFYRGEYPAADSLFRRALALRRALLGPEHADLAQTLDQFGQLQHTRARFAEAESLYQEALAMRRHLLGSGHASVATSLNNLGSLYHDRGDLVAAERFHQEALAISRKRLGANHPDLAIDLNNLGSVYYDRGEVERAEALFRESLAIRRRVLGPAHPDVATAVNNLASLLHEKGDLAGAEALYRESLALRRQALGERHPRVVLSLNNLAVLLHEKKDYASAESYYREAMALRRTLYEREHPDLAIDLNNLGKLLYDEGDYAGAEQLHREALALRRRLLPAEHPEIALSLHHLGATRHAQGDLQGAEPLYREALAIRRKALPENHWHIGLTELFLGNCMTGLRRFEEAEPLLLHAYTALNESRGPAARETQDALRSLVNLYEAWEKPDRARPYRMLRDGG